MRKRGHVVPLRLHTRELRYLNEQVAVSGLNREEFLRSLIMGAELKLKPCEHHVDLLRKISGYCNNANQLARVANTYGTVSESEIQRMMEMGQALWKLLKEW